MVNTAECITRLGKAKKWSQEDLSKQIDSSKAIISKYELKDNLCSIEVTIKRAKAFEVSADFRVGEEQNATNDKDIVKRLDDLQNITKNEKLLIFNYMD
jgi:ribosome-binding protein aMBF1 (putative translation factor)